MPGELTSEGWGRLRVPLRTLPKLDVLGLSVEVDQADSGQWSGTVCDEDLVHDRWTVFRAGGPVEVWTRNLTIDLADPATADRCARWLAGRVGLAVGCTAPSVTLTRDGRLGVCATRASQKYVRIPSLATLDPADPRTLPDGSRWVDRAALAEVCRHVGRPS